MHECLPEPTEAAAVTAWHYKLSPARGATLPREGEPGVRKQRAGGPGGHTALQRTRLTFQKGARRTHGGALPAST